MANQVTKSDKNWIAREVFSGSIKAIGYQATITYVLPLGLAFVTGLAGYLQGLPWMHILVGAGVMFGAITTGLVRFDDWRERRRIKGKLVVPIVNAGRDTQGPGIVLGVALLNEASFPLEWELTECRTRIQNRVPPNLPYRSTRITLGPKGEGFFNDHPIDIGTPPSPGTVEGFLEMSFKYGQPGKLKYDLAIKKQVVITFNDDGVFAGGTWHDAGQ
jgi:hypothetical protein